MTTFTFKQKLFVYQKLNKYLRNTLYLRTWKNVLVTKNKDIRKYIIKSYKHEDNLNFLRGREKIKVIYDKKLIFNFCMTI